MKDEESILKTVRGELQVIYEDKPIKIIAKFLKETLKSKSLRIIYFKI